jgi:NAD-dependent DNA ligase
LARAGSTSASPARAAQNASSSSTKSSGATLPNAPQKQCAHLRGVGDVYARRAVRFLDAAHAHEAWDALLEDRVREREVQPNDENILDRQRAHRVRVVGVALGLQ